MNADRLRLCPHHGVWRCRSCRRTTTREAPHRRCIAWRCDGTLEWEREDDDNYDLQILVIGHVDRDDVDALLWDPMPGGSGLLDQLCERFGEIVETARGVAGACPGRCESSCIDCLETFRNAYYHRHLDRGTAHERLDEWGRQLAFDHELPRQQPDAPPGDQAAPVNDAEIKLRHLLLAAGFGEGVRGEQIRLGGTLGTTTPDVIYRAEDHDPDEGVCIYLDRLSAELHGDPRRTEHDAGRFANPRQAGHEGTPIDWMRLSWKHGFSSAEEAEAT